MSMAYAWLTRFLLLPLLAWLWWRGRREPAYRRGWAQRLGGGAVSPSHVGALWVHAASVGEVQAAQALIALILDQAPDHAVVVSTQTPTGAKALRERWGDRVLHVYAPLDTPGATRRWFERWQPRALVLVERELWPNWLGVCFERAVPVWVVNARLTERTASAYAQRAALMAPVWAQLAGVVAADEASAQRFERLGVPAERLQVAGNLKFDVPLAQAKAVAAWPGRRWVVLGSSHEGDEEVLLAGWAAWHAQHPQDVLVLVPRHPQRFDAVTQRLAGSGLKFERLSQGLRGAAETQVVLVDAMGELMGWYQLADVALVGGTWANVGGHNPLEPLSLGKPVLFGPHTHNAQSMFDDIQAHGLGVRVNGGAAFWTVLAEWMGDDAQRQVTGERALAWLAGQRGAAQRTWGLLQVALPLTADAQGDHVQTGRLGGADHWVSARLGAGDAHTAEWLDVRRLAEAKTAQVLAEGSGRGRALAGLVNGCEVVLRHYWRGGLIGRFNRDLFMGASLHRSRAMAEFALLRHLRAWGLPVPEPLAARRQAWLGWYRADIAVGRIPDSENLVQRLRRQTMSAEAWTAVGRVVRRLHERQVFHSDLNAHNLLIDGKGAIWVVDFDRCAVRPGQAWKAENLARLLRSLRKEQGRVAGLNWAETDWADLIRAYEAV
jgi:3-deoxy-D-manno-octulosonic-acid transferase